MKYGVGHLNFWPNGGTKQPGCTLPEIIARYGFAVNWMGWLPNCLTYLISNLMKLKFAVFCNHFRSYQLYVESILTPKLMPAKKCDSYLFYKLGSCKNNDIAYLGYLADSRLVS